MQNPMCLTFKNATIIKDRLRKTESQTEREQVRGNESSHGIIGFSMGEGQMGQFDPPPSNLWSWTP